MSQIGQVVKAKGEHAELVKIFLKLVKELCVHGHFTHLSEEIPEKKDENDQIISAKIQAGPVFQNQIDRIRMGKFFVNWETLW